MKSQNKVVCVHCGEQIKTLDDLVIRSLNYSTHALHRACYEKVRSRWIYRLSLDMRGWGFWAYLVLINGLLVGCLIALPDSWQDLRWFFLIGNIPMIVFRVLAFISYELPLKD